LPKDKRREQLLDVAMTIVRARGTDELTLVSLAAAAGVSRPVAYEHFSTRAGLLLALFQRLEDRFVQALRDALAIAPRNLQAVAGVMSTAYFNCLSDLGPEGPALSAALKGSEEMARRQHLMTGEYVEIMRLALRPFTSARASDLNLLCIGVLGAAEAIAREMQAGRVSKATAARALSALIAKTIARGDAGEVGRRTARAR
jgi:AcrR family transcriptional regulator